MEKPQPSADASQPPSARPPRPNSAEPIVSAASGALTHSRHSSSISNGLFAEGARGQHGRIHSTVRGAATAAAACNSGEDASLSATVVVTHHSHSSTGTTIVHQAPGEVAGDGPSPRRWNSGVGGSSSAGHGTRASESDVGSVVIHRTPVSGALSPRWDELLGRSAMPLPQGVSSDHHRHRHFGNRDDSDDSSSDETVISHDLQALKVTRKRRRRARRQRHGDATSSLPAAHRVPRTLRERLIMEQNELSRKRAELEAQKLRRLSDQGATNHEGGAAVAVGEPGSGSPPRGARQGDGSFSPSPDRPSATGELPEHTVRASLVGPGVIQADEADTVSFFHLHRVPSRDEALREVHLTPQDTQGALWVPSAPAALPSTPGARASPGATEGQVRLPSLSAWPEHNPPPMFTVTSPPNISLSAAFGAGRESSTSPVAASLTSGVGERSGRGGVELPSALTSSVPAALRQQPQLPQPSASLEPEPVPLANLFSQGPTALTTEEALACPPAVHFDGLRLTSAGALFDVFYSTHAHQPNPAFACQGSAPAGERSVPEAPVSSRSMSPVARAASENDPAKSNTPNSHTAALVGSPSPSTQLLPCTRNDPSADERGPPSTGPRCHRKQRRSTAATSEAHRRVTHTRHPQNRASGTSSAALFTPPSAGLDGPTSLDVVTRSGGSLPPSAMGKVNGTKAASAPSLLSSGAAVGVQRSKRAPVPLSGASAPLRSVEDAPAPTIRTPMLPAREVNPTRGRAATHNTRQWTTVTTGTLMDGLARGAPPSPVRAVTSDPSSARSTSLPAAATAAGAGLIAPRRTPTARLSVRVFAISASAVLEMLREVLARTGSDAQQSPPITATDVQGTPEADHVAASTANVPAPGDTHGRSPSSTASSLSSSLLGGDGVPDPHATAVRPQRRGTTAAADGDPTEPPSRQAQSHPGLADSADEEDSGNVGSWALSRFASQHARSSTNQPGPTTRSAHGSPPHTTNHRYTSAFLRDHTAVPNGRTSPVTARATLEPLSKSSSLSDVGTAAKLASCSLPKDATHDEGAELASTLHQARVAERFDQLFLPRLAQHLRELLGITDHTLPSRAARRSSSLAMPAVLNTATSEPPRDGAGALKAGDGGATLSASQITAIPSCATTARVPPYLTLPVLGLHVQMAPFRCFAPPGAVTTVRRSVTETSKRASMRAHSTTVSPLSFSHATPQRAAARHANDEALRSRYDMASPSNSSDENNDGRGEDVASDGEGSAGLRASIGRLPKSLASSTLFATGHCGPSSPTLSTVAVPVPANTPVLTIALAYPTIQPGNVRDAFRRWVSDTDATPVEREFIVRNIVLSALRQLTALHAAGCAHGSVKSTNLFSAAHAAQALMSASQGVTGAIPMATVRALASSPGDERLSGTAVARSASSGSFVAAGKAPTVNVTSTPLTITSTVGRTPGVPVYSTAFVSRAQPLPKGEGDAINDDALCPEPQSPNSAAPRGTRGTVGSAPHSETEPSTRTRHALSTPAVVASAATTEDTVMAGRRTGVDVSSHSLPTAEVDVDGGADIYRWSTEVVLVDEAYATVEHAVRCAVVDAVTAPATALAHPSASAVNAESWSASANNFAFPTSNSSSPWSSTLPMPLARGSMTSSVVSSAYPGMPPSTALHRHSALDAWLHPAEPSTRLFPLAQAEVIPPPEFIVDEGVTGTEKGDVATSDNAKSDERNQPPDVAMNVTHQRNDMGSRSGDPALPPPPPQYPFRLHSLCTDYPLPLQTFAGDVWMLGMLAVELADGPVPQEQKQRRRPRPALRYRPWSSHFAGFVQRCLVEDPAQRPSAAALLDDPWFTATLMATPTDTKSNARGEGERVLSLARPPQGREPGSLIRLRPPPASTAAASRRAAEAEPPATGAIAGRQTEAFTATRLYLHTTADVCRQFRHHGLAWLQATLAAARQKKHERQRQIVERNIARIDNDRPPTYTCAHQQDRASLMASVTSDQRRQSQSPPSVAGVQSKGASSPANSHDHGDWAAHLSALSKSPSSPANGMLATQLPPPPPTAGSSTRTPLHLPLAQLRSVNSTDGPAGEGEDDDETESSHPALLRTLPMANIGGPVSSALEAEPGWEKTAADVVATQAESSSASSASLFDVASSCWTPSDDDNHGGTNGDSDAPTSQGGTAPRRTTHDRTRRPPPRITTTAPSVTLGVVTSAIELCRQQAHLEGQLLRRHGQSPWLLARRGSAMSAAFTLGPAIAAALGVPVPSPHLRTRLIGTPAELVRGRSDSLHGHPGSSFASWSVSGMPGSPTLHAHRLPAAATTVTEMVATPPGSPTLSLASSLESSFFLNSDDEVEVAAEIAALVQDEPAKPLSSTPSRARRQSARAGEGAVTAIVPSTLRFEVPPPILLNIGDADDEDDLLDTTEGEKQLTNILQAFLSLARKHPLAADVWCFQLLRHLGKDARTAELAKELEVLWSPPVASRETSRGEGAGDAPQTTTTVPETSSVAVSSTPTGAAGVKGVVSPRPETAPSLFNEFEVCKWLLSATAALDGAKERPTPSRPMPPPAPPQTVPS